MYVYSDWLAGTNQIMFPSTLDRGYEYNLTISVAGTYGAFEVEIMDNSIMVPPDCEAHNILMMLGVDHSKNQWERGDNPSEFDVSMVVGAEFPCTHIWYGLSDNDDNAFVTLAQGSSIINFPRLRQVEIDALYDLKEDDHVVVPQTPSLEIAAEKLLSMKLNQLPKVKSNEWTYFYTLNVRAMSNTNVAYKNYLGSLTVPAQCMHDDVDLSSMSTTHSIKKIKDISGLWIPDEPTLMGACTKFWFSFDVGTNKNLVLSKTGKGIRYPRTQYKKAKKYKVKLIVSVSGEYGHAEFSKNGKITVPARKNNSATNKAEDYEIPS